MLKIAGGILIAVLILPSLAWAKKKPAYVYQDGVLQGFHREHSGNTCSGSSDTSGTVNANTDSAGQTNGTVDASTSGSSSCSDLYRYLYTVQVGNNVYVITPTHSGKAMAGAMLTMGWGALAWKQSALANHLPGTPIQVRTEENNFYVRVGKRESMFAVVEAK